MHKKQGINLDQGRKTGSANDAVSKKKYLSRWQKWMTCRIIIKPDNLKGSLANFKNNTGK